MKKQLAIIDSGSEDKLRLNINILLDNMVLIVEKKLASSEVLPIYRKEYKITLETNFEKVFYEFYEEYLNLKEIESYWKDAFSDEDMEVIEYNRGVVEED